MGDMTAKTLSDSDIATYQRRPGPSGAPAGTDADTQTDADTAPAVASDSDAVSDHDTGKS